MANRVVKYCPKGEVFEGYVMIRMPKFKERLALIKGLGISTDEKGEVGMNDDSLEKAAQLVGIAHEHVESVQLKHVESGIEFSSMDDLDMYEEGTQLIQEIAGMVINGVKLGKISSES